MRKGLPASIFTDGRSYSNGGLSSYAKRVTVIGDDIDAVHGNVSEPSPAAPAVRLVRRVIGGEPYIHAEPVPPENMEPGLVGPMMGGTFIYTSDSRLRDIIPYPIPLHDRYETVEQYRALSAD